MKLTKQDREVLTSLDMYGSDSVSPRRVAAKSGIRTSSPGETAARHLIKLTKLGLADKTGSRMFPEWRINEAGRQALNQKDKSDAD